MDGLDVPFIFPQTPNVKDQKQIIIPILPLIIFKYLARVIEMVERQDWFHIKISVIYVFFNIFDSEILNISDIVFQYH